VTGTVSNTGGLTLHCRTEPNTSSTIIEWLEPGSTIEVRGDEVDGWIPVRCADQDGWVSADYLTLSTDDSTPDAATTMVVIDGEVASCRLDPSIDSLIIARLPAGTEVTVRGEMDAGWVPVVCDGQDGWMVITFLAPVP
jgi:uncharacterized protein YgiM (DUF1202 family)